ncbi:glutathione S-transferase family protein [Labrenzia sp. DG1229]|uniref:glutathione S-transferase family protein n=1 Tax=Labrenzia sp. DG1229 TaxID=681847 RepID=UPI00048EA987|nr:glutathione S-transferase family protein [Labrenzia sp. DG1229]
MSKSVVLRGYRYSVYNRIARIVLQEKGVDYKIEEINPFASDVPADYLERQPFCRVPVLSHGTFDVFETCAIARYVDAAFDGAKLVPVAARALARATQVISIVDSYGYRPMVRQVFAQRVFAPLEGHQADETEIAAGLDASQVVLDALNKIAVERLVLDGRNFTIADCHLAPMVAYFVQAPEGADALSRRSELAQWWASVSKRTSVRMTDPGLPTRGNP